ncbi:hypothetical protein C8R41DRAFT_870301 [Lentinula lateritia]|uniref:Uncharacterized protein n=1 Tax=Lentinula lateritia TaxID=40482 RepID=A0ABQ8V404_9AGAR|nr:hypothetical protein C8R41DRAFT_870301 [Lentinula lateritia]
MAEPDTFVSTYNEKHNPINIPYPLVNSVPMHPSEVIRIQNEGKLFFCCTHGMICEAWYIGLNSANELRRFRLNDIYDPLHQAHQLKASHKMESHPFPPQSWKWPSSLIELPNTPIKCSKKIGKQMAKNTIPASDDGVTTLWDPKELLFIMKPRNSKGPLQRQQLILRFFLTNSTGKSSNLKSVLKSIINTIFSKINKNGMIYSRISKELELDPTTK